MRISAIAAVLAVTITGGCAMAPIAPTVAVSPGPGKTADAFKADDASCRQEAGSAANQAAKVANQTSMGNTLGNIAAGAVTGGSASTAAITAVTGAQGSTTATLPIQQQYDDAYKNCMYTKGNVVPGMAPPAPPPSVAVPPAPRQRDRLVLQVQQQLVRLGYLSGGADGVAGRKTAAAITKYEQDHALPVDGVSSTKLLRTLQADGGAGSGAGGGELLTPPPPPPAAGGAS